MSVTTRSLATRVVVDALRACDPQESGVESKAERIVEALEANCLLGFGRPIERVHLKDCARYLH